MTQNPRYDKPNVLDSVLPASLRRGGQAALLRTLLTAVLLFAAASILASAQRTPVLHSQVPALVSSGQAALIGSMPPDQQINFSIVLPLRNKADLDRLLARLYDPSSPDFHHFLTADQFTAQFGPTVQDYQAVAAFARAQGFKVTGTPANRLVVPLSGMVYQVESAFNVRMNLYQHPAENRTFFSPDRNPSLNLSVSVAGVSGLNNFSLPHPMVIPPTSEQPQAGTVTGSGPQGSYLGSDMRAAYYGGTALDGNGQAVGLLEFDGYDLSDVNSTFSNAGQTYNVPVNNVLLDGATGEPTFPDEGGEAEVVLDIVQAIGMAPGLSQVRVYIGSGGDDASILNAIASEDIAKQISCSWSWQPANPSIADAFFEEMAAQGQSFFAASGDAGAYDASVNPYFYPQEDAYVTAVGGTHLTTTAAGGPWSAETAWNSPFHGGSGGGISPDSIAIPSWQSGVANASNAGSSTLRNVPDVAMEGDFDNYNCKLGACSGGWAGTSFAAPRWAGFMALVNEQAVEAGNAPLGGIGFLNPSLYILAQGAPYADDLHDIISGNNDTDNQPVYYNAVAGYDLVTGWGSPTGQSLINDLAGAQVPGFWIIGSPATVNVNQGASSSTTISVSDAGGFSGNVTLAVTSPLPTGVTASWGTNPTSASSVLTFTATGSAPLSITPVTIAATSGKLSATSTVTVAVRTPTFALSAIPNAIGIKQGGTATSTVKILPEYGFTGSVNLSISGLPSGVTGSFSPSSTTNTSTLTLTASSSAAGGTSTFTITGTSGSITQTTTLALTVQAPSFQLSAPTTVVTGQGTVGTAEILIQSLYGFTGNVNLTVSGLPSGVTGSFAPNPTTNSSILTLTASASASLGDSTITVTGTSGSLTSTALIALSIRAPTFTLATLSTLDIGQGTSGNAYINVVPQYGFTGSVAFSVSGLPAGVIALWSPNPATGSTTLSLTATSAAATGSSTVTVSGASGSITASTTFTLTIHAPSFSLTSSGSINLGQGTTNTSYIFITPQYGFTGKVNLSVSGLPSGVTASFSPNPATGESMMTLTATSGAPLGTQTVTVSGTSGSLTASTTIVLGIYTPTFTIYGASVANIGQGASGTAFLYVNPAYGFNGNVTFSVSGLPAGVTASFSPNPTANSSGLTLTAASTAAIGQYTLTITGTSGSQTTTTTLTLNIYAPGFTLSSYGSVAMGQGKSTTTYIFVSPQYGFSGSVNLSISGLPAGVTASFSPNPATNSSMLTLTASSTVATGQYNLTITGTSGAQTATTPLALGVYTPAFALYAGSVYMGVGSTGTTFVIVEPQYGFSGNVNLSISGLPSGVTASFSPNPTTGDSTLTVTASGAATPGAYTLTVTGASGAQTATTTVPLNLNGQSFTLSANPVVQTLDQGASGSSTITVFPQYGFTGSVTFSASGLPAGVTASFSPTSATGSSTLTLTASGTAAPVNSAAITISGSSGGITASTTVYLTINAQGFTLDNAPGEINLLRGGSAKSLVVVVPQNGFAGSTTLSASGLPSGVSAVFSPNPTNGSSVLTLTAASTAAAGSTTIGITGSSGSLTATTSAVVNVNAAAPAATTTTLQVSAGGNAVTSVAAGSMVTLTAAVSDGSTALKTGQVNFCEAAANGCDATHLIGSAQLTSAGTAKLQFFPGMGLRGYKAVFAGTHAEASSSSAAADLTVTASQPTTAALTQSGSAGNYTLTATVTGQGAAAPTGTVSFLDTTNNNAALGTASLGNDKPTITWNNPQSPAVGQNPTAIAVGDFDGNGIPDLAVANTASGTLTILLGKGDGSFTAASSSPATGSSPEAVVASDFNGDGILDLAVANTSNSNLTILLGNGDGTFTATPTNPPTGSEPVRMAVGDFNGDGIPDLAVVNAGSSTVTVELGNGDGSFTPSPLSAQTGNAPNSLVMEDFNGDGILDLAVLSNNGGSVTLLLGNGDGSFTLDSSIGVSPSSYASTLIGGDFNQDGKFDLAVINGSTDSLQAYLGNGDGTFTAMPSSSTSLTAASNAAVADFNGDGIPDIVETSTSQAGVLYGNGDGTFGAPVTFSGVAGASAIAVHDFDGNGAQDLAIPGPYSAKVTILDSQLSHAVTAVATGVSPAGTGSHTVSASYPGDTGYQGSRSTSVSLQGELVTPTVTVAPSSSSITTAQTLTVSVAVASSGNPIATGSVTLSSGSYTSAAATLAGGAATINIPAGSLATGNDTLSVAYTPDSSSSSIYNSASGTASVAVANRATPTVTVTPSSSSITTAQTLTVSVTVASSGNPIATGSVTLSSGSYTSAAATLAGGAATINIPAGSLAAGNDTLSVAYTPDSSSSSIYNSASGTASVAVAPTIGTTAAMVTATPSVSTITDLQTVTVEVTVAGATGQPAPTGTVALSSGSYSAQQALSGGVASFTIAAGALGSGADTLTAAYSGDAVFAGASATTTITVAPVLIAAPTLNAVSAGSNATGNLMLTAGSNYSGSLSLSCTLTSSPAGAQSLPACNLNPANLALASGGKETSALTITTTAASTAYLVPPAPRQLRNLGGMGSLLACVLMIGIPARRRRWISMLALLLFVAVAGTIGCGGAGSSHAPQPPQQTTPATTAGNYTFAVKATDSAANVAVSTNITLTVEK